MLDDLRNSASSFIEEEAPLEEEIVRKKRKKGPQENFLGMTPPQRGGSCATSSSA